MYELRQKELSRQFLVNNQRFFKLINEAYSVILLGDHIQRLDILTIIYTHIKQNLTLVLDKRYTQDENNIGIVQTSLNMIKFIENRLNEGEEHYRDYQVEKFKKVTSYLKLKMKNSVYEL